MLVFSRQPEPLPWADGAMIELFARPRVLLRPVSVPVRLQRQSPVLPRTVAHQ